MNGQTSDYTDTSGHVWLAGAVGGNPNTMGSGCCGGDDGGYPSNNDYGGSWPSIPDILLYETPWYSFYDTNDIRFDIYVPNGTYSIDEKFAAVRVDSAGQQYEGLEAQGNVQYSNLDFYALAGYKEPIDYTLTAAVTNGLLSIVVRHMGGQFNDISAVSITQISSGGGSPAPD